MAARNALILAIGAPLLAGLAPGAHAALGDTVDMAAIRAEAQQVSAKRAASDEPGIRKIVHKAGFDQILSVDANGAEVRESVSSDGKVFAAAWDGQALPDLRTLLGNHYDDYMRAAEQLPPNARMLDTTVNGVRMNFIKTMRFSRGSAVLVNELPEGVGIGAIK